MSLAFSSLRNLANRQEFDVCNRDNLTNECLFKLYLPLKTSVQEVIRLIAERIEYPEQQIIIQKPAKYEFFNQSPFNCKPEEANRRRIHRYKRFTIRMRPSVPLIRVDNWEKNQASISIGTVFFPIVSMFWFSDSNKHTSVSDRLDYPSIFSSVLWYWRYWNTSFPRVLERIPILSEELKWRNELVISVRPHRLTWHLLHLPYILVVIRNWKISIPTYVLLQHHRGKSFSKE